MADGYLEKRMEDYLAGRLKPAKKKPTYPKKKPTQPSQSSSHQE